MPIVSPTGVLEHRIHAIRSFHDAAGASRAELDVSGGVDSAVMLGLLVRALGPDRVTAVYTGIHSSEDSRLRARAAARAFDLPLVELDLSGLFDELVAHLLSGLTRAGVDPASLRHTIARDPQVLGSLRSCLRAPVGRGINRLMGSGLRHGTGNECEDRFIRFYQKGGDGEVDSNPIAMLSKGEVYQLAVALGVPQSIIEATPTPDLRGLGNEHHDEAELLELTGVPWTYSRVDPSTGAYRSVGTIERVSRFLDLSTAEISAFPPRPSETVASVVFGADDPREFWPALVAAARPFFADLPGHDDAKTASFLRSARRLEQTSRHKWNPNCPALGDRRELLELGLLTNDLPIPYTIALTGGPEGTAG